MRRNAAATIVLLVSVLVPGCSRSYNTVDVEEAVVKAQRQWEKALQDFDLDSLKRLLADDYSQTDLRGRVQDRTSWIEYFTPYVAAVHAGDAHFEISFEDQKTRVYRDSAVVTGGATFKGNRSRNGVLLFDPLVA
jgi:hypothetical protein